jgi:autotransporter-associated beta strand protein
MSKKISDIRSLVVLAACGCGVFLHAADRNWNPGGSALWTNAAIWAEGAVPTADDNVSLNNSNTLTITRGVSAYAKTVTLSNVISTTYQTLMIANGARLTVGGAISDPGAGTADIRVNNTNEANAASVLTATSVACREFSIPSDPLGPQYLTTGYDMTLASWINVHLGAPVYCNTFRQTNGTVQNRTTSDPVVFQNGYALENYNGCGVKDTQFNTSKPTTIQLAQNGTHTFYADGSGNKICISPSAQIVNKTGEVGTLLKAGAGDLVLTGGGLAATNAWTGDTTVLSGRIKVDYTQIAGAPGSLVLNNAYSPASRLIFNGGGFDLTGRGNATNSTFICDDFTNGTCNHQHSLADSNRPLDKEYSP